MVTLLCLQDIQIEALLIRACEPVIQSHCHVSTDSTHIQFIPFIYLFFTLNSSCGSLSSQDVADNQIDMGNLLECLVQNKHQREMNDKCAVGVTHFQLVSQSHC